MGWADAIDEVSCQFCVTLGLLAKKIKLVLLVAGWLSVMMLEDSMNGLQKARPGPNLLLLKCNLIRD